MKDFNGFVEGPKDALIIIEAAKLGYFRLVRNRLSQYEKNNIYPGSCFVWEQRGSSIQRWTDGRSWLHSKYSEGFFSYVEKPKRKNRNRSKPYNLIKRTFTIADYNGMKFQLINYIYKDPKENRELLRPSSYAINHLLLNSDTNANFRKLSFFTLSSNNDLTLDSTSLMTLIPPIENLGASPLPYIDQSPLHISLSLIANFKPLETLECYSVNESLFSEDVRQLSLLDINL